MFTIKQHDLLPAFRRTLTSSSASTSAIDLTGCAVWFVMTAVGASSPTIQNQATIVDATKGIVEYAWGSGETNTTGVYQVEWEITYPDGSPRTVPNADYDFVTITPDLGGSGAVLPASPVSSTVLLLGVPTDGQIPTYVAADGVARWSTLDLSAYVTLTGAQSLTNKTLDATNTVAKAAVVGAPAGAFVGTTDTQTLSGKTIDGGSNTLSNVPTSALTGTIPTSMLTGTISTAVLVGSIALASISGIDTNVATFLGTPSSANLRAAMTDETGTGAAVFANTPTLVTPKVADAAGGQAYRFVPSDIAADRDVTLPLLAGNDTFVFEAHTQTLTNKTLSGASNTFSNIGLSSLTGLATGVSTLLGAFSSTNLAAALTDETGTGAAVFATSPTLVTPNIGAATGTSLSFGATPATLASVRVANNAGNILAQSNGSGGNHVLISTSSSELCLGSDNAFGTNVPNVRIYPSGNFFVGIGSSTKLTVTSTLNTFANPISIEKPGIATTSTDGLSLDNTTASTSGVPVQYSTRLRQRGHAWNSTSSLDETHDWATEVRPATAAGATSSYLAIARSLNGGAYSDVVGFGSAGGTSTGLASQGAIRLAGGSNVLLGIRANSGLSDMIGLAVNTSNELFIGSSTGFGTQVVSLRLYSGGTTYIGSGSNNAVLIDYTNGLQTSDRNISIGLTPSYGGGVICMFIKNASTVPSSNPSGGGVVYVEAGALKYRGSSGTVTVLAAA